MQCVTPGLNCGSIPQAIVNIVGNNCTCVAGLTAQYGSNGRLQSCSALQSPPPSNTAVQDTASISSGTWTAIPVLANNASTATALLQYLLPSGAAEYQSWRMPQVLTQ
jgi:hypothetical protein